MEIKTQEHADLMAMFDRIYKGRRLDRENKKIWPMGRIYQDGELNELFLAFRQGVAYGRALSR